VDFSRSSQKDISREAEVVKFHFFLSKLKKQPVFAKNVIEKYKKSKFKEAKGHPFGAHVSVSSPAPTIVAIFRNFGFNEFLLAVQERANAAISSILAKYQKPKPVLASPVLNRFENTVRSISTLQTSRRTEEMLGQLANVASASTPAATTNAAPVTAVSAAVAPPPAS